MSKVSRRDLDQRVEFIRACLEEQAKVIGQAIRKLHMMIPMRQELEREEQHFFRKSL